MNPGPVGVRRAVRPSGQPDTAVKNAEPGFVRFGVLGPVVVMAADGECMPLPAQKMRILVAALVTSGGRPLSADHLTDALWNGDPPASAHKNLHQYVHRLRAHLARCGLTERLVRGPSGYLLRVYPGELDADRFHTLAGEGRAARARGELGSAEHAFADALSMWRGDALADVRSSMMLSDAAHGLTESRLGVIEEYVDVELRMGHHTLVIPELAQLVMAHPFRERMREFQMLALYASGRKADALAAYQECRLVLARELGIDPGPALNAVLAAIMGNDDRELAPRLSRSR
ncbi:AfsR/SARP family transcriptional regulator [Streptomyces sp. NPDC051976]|uniref:AfsR/SARP family transcriptional regulator n=1 Tax=Streptomyces sp. NPDC051976 TaxID=3154947 RepID=UPI00343879E1